MTTNELRDLAATLSAGPRADSWAWQAGEDYPEPDGYLDCSSIGDGRYQLEVSDGHDTAQLTLSVHDLADIHKQLTVQLMVAQMRDQRCDVDTAAAEARDDNVDGM